MPKKTRNAFYYFMMDFKEEQRKKGINYNNMSEVSEAAGPAWSNAPQSVQTKFKLVAQKAKQKSNSTVMKFTSTGINIADLEREAKDLRDAEEREIMDIKNFIAINTISGCAPTTDIYIIDVNAYCKIGAEYMIGESTILRFNLNDGIKDIYHEIINPGSIPIGYAYDAKLGSKELGLDMPDETVPRSNYMQILANTIDYLKQHDRSAKTLPPIFTMPEKVAAVDNFILQMCRRAAEDETLFRIYRIDTLFFTLINAIKSRADEGFPKESLALVQLKKDPFKYSMNIACEHHNEIDMTPECTTSRVKRWAFTVMDSCCPVVGVDMKPGKHLPYDYDMDSILTYKEQKRGKSGPTVAVQHARGDVSTYSDSSSVDGSLSVSMTSTESKKNKRVHVPLRMPKSNYSQTFRVAPELSETDFPSFPPMAGRGRGMGSSGSLSGRLNNMNIKK